MSSLKQRLIDYYIIQPKILSSLGRVKYFGKNWVAKQLKRQETRHVTNCHSRGILYKRAWARNFRACNRARIVSSRGIQWKAAPAV